MWMLKPRSDLHLIRKVYHVLGVLVMIVLHHNMTRSQALYALAISAAIILSVDFGRQKIKFLNKVAYYVFGPFMRRNELHGITGTSNMVLGVYFMVYLYPQSVVTLTLYFLALGDPVASTFGILFGKDRLIGEKTLQGTTACFICCTVIAGLYYLNHNLMVDRFVMASILSGLIGAFSELIPIGRLDDNLTLPVISATLLYILFGLFGAL